MRTRLLRFICLGSLILCLTVTDLQSQAFTEQTGIVLSGASNSSVDWGDFNNDGYLDLVVVSNNGSKIYRNKGNNTFSVLSGISLPNISRGTAAWGDCDNDGDLDLLVAGDGATRIYRHDIDTVFTELSGTGLPVIYENSSVWGDYDNDGFLDVFILGYTGFKWSSTLWRNNRNNTFTLVNDTGIPSTTESGRAAWGDYDNDGDLDLLVTGYTPSIGQSTLIFRNDGLSFSRISTDIPGVSNGSVRWGDYDNDNDLDFLLSGYNWSIGNISRIYNNDSGSFTDIGAGLSGAVFPSAAWGDYDNDGDLDILLTGEAGSSNYLAKVYRNDGGTFYDTGASLTPVGYGSVAWGDYDKDNDLDIILTGWNSSSNISKIYKNNSSTSNTSPSAPTGLSSVFSPDSVTLFWNKSSDSQTPQNGLSYNLYIGTASGTVNKRTPMAALPGGLRKIAGKGVIQSSSWVIERLPAGTYYWGVQATDNGFAGSAFSTESSFIVPFSNSIGPAGDQKILINQACAALTVTESTTSSSRQWKYSTTDRGPYDQTISGATGTTCTTSFNASGIYYIVCESTYGGQTYTSNQVKIIVTIFLEQVGHGLQGVTYSSTSYGDYDNDGDLDLLLTGWTGSDRVSKIYKNGGSGTFTEQTGIVLPGVERGATAWGDYNNDGYLDFILTGDTVPGRISKIYFNNGNNTFTENINANLPGVRSGSVAWADYDIDGDLDLLLTGESYNGSFSELYRNDAGFFTAVNSGIRGARINTVDWGDFDNDGDMDILIAGYNDWTYGFTLIYRNDNGSFIPLDAGLAANPDASCSWGDYDNDGDLDILVACPWNLSVYTNTNGTFSNQAYYMPDFYSGKAVWGDYDNDGDLDILVNGSTFKKTVSRIIQNTSNVFSEVYVYFDEIEMVYGSMTWGDHDNDGDMDLIMTGHLNGIPVSRLYRNNITIQNTVPSAPAGLAANVSGAGVTFTWNKSSDAQTAQDGLSYNLYIGTAPGSISKRSPMSAVPGGKRRIVHRGDVQGTTFLQKMLPAGTYYWSVQAVDNSFAGSSFGAENSFTVLFSNQVAPNSDQTLGINQNGTVLTVTESSTPTSRQWKYSSAPGGPYDQTITGATGTSYTPNFSKFGTFYVVCTSVKAGITYTSNEVKIIIPAFTEQTGIVLPGISDGSVAWGDYDNDDDLDILITGYSNTSGYTSVIYRNDAGVFTDIAAGLSGLYESSAAWGDYDNDGDLDIILTGGSNTAGNNTIIYRNNAGIFTDINAGLTGVRNGASAWGDYDNDGDLDILLTGSASSGSISKIYRNDTGAFTDIGAGLIGVTASSVDWGDYDNDGDLDILISGSWESKIYRNDNGTFTDISAGLTGSYGASVEWGDYDNDGDLDILLTEGTRSRIYNNNSGIFTDINAGLSGLRYGSAVWGDYDNDGDLDILLSGAGISKIYRNDGSLFTDTMEPLTGLSYTSVAWGDYDKDGDLDFLLSGNPYTTKIYKNNSLVANSAPSAPTGLKASAENISMVMLTWTKASDSKTVDATLTYNIRVGTSVGGTNILGPMSSTGNGYRRIPAPGNAEFMNDGFALKNLPAGRYYWSVQAVDQSYAGGAWATEGQFYLLAAPVANAATYIIETSLTANWTASSGATGYRIDVATDSAFTALVTGYNNKDVGNVTTYTILGLTQSTAYYYRIRAYNAGGTSIVYSNIIKTVTIGIPAAPVPAATSDIVQTSFTANWQSSAYAYGYLLDVSTSDTFSSFVTGFSDKDVGNLTSFSVTGLTANTVYYYRVRAYNEYGTSTNSGTITVTTLMNPPATPGGLTAYSCNDYVWLNWTAISDANFYRYYIYSGSTPNPTVIVDSTTSISDVSRGYSDLMHGNTYYFRIKAVNTGKIYSGFSNEVSVVVKKGVVPKIKAKWNNVLICYNIGDSLTTWQWYKNDAAISNATKQFYVTNKAPGTYYVQARDKSLCFNSSNSINITGAKSVYFYPNPAGTNVTMSLSGEDYGRTIVRFYNSQGVKVLEYQAEKTDFELRHEIALKSLRNGTYTIEVLVNDEYVDYSRIVIVK